jgi:hypothetical protein
MTDPNDSPDQVGEHPVADPLTHDTAMSGHDDSDTLTHETAMSGHDEDMASDMPTHDTTISTHDEDIMQDTLTHDTTMSGHEEGVELDGLPQDSHLSVEVHGDADDILHEHSHHEHDSRDDSFQRDDDLDAYDPNTEGENPRDDTVDDQNILNTMKTFYHRSRKILTCLVVRNLGPVTPASWRSPDRPLIVDHMSMSRKKKASKRTHPLKNTESRVPFLFQKRGTRNQLRHGLPILPRTCLRQLVHHLSNLRACSLLLRVRHPLALVSHLPVLVCHLFVRV